jgi:hypothetical protein
MTSAAGGNAGRCAGAGSGKGPLGLPITRVALPGSVMNVHRHAERFRRLYVSTVIRLGLEAALL